MKLLFKLISVYLFISVSNATVLFQINHNEEMETKANIIKLDLIERGIPESFIYVKTTDQCLKNKNLVFQACISKKGKVTFPFINKRILLNSFKFARKDTPYDKQ